MATIPLAVAESPQTLALKKVLVRLHQGKVRDTFRLPEGRLLVHATDRLSIFDFVLAILVPFKGEVLTALTHFWLTKVLKEFPNHLLAAEICEWLIPYPQIDPKSCLTVKRVDMIPYELIFRRHIGGSVFKKYQETGLAAGIELPRGLAKWSKLDSSLFTPSTKEDEGHDVNITAEEFFRATGESGRKLAEMLAAAYAKAYDYAEKKGVLILDTKFEAAADMIADEVLTPDSSRFVDADEWKLAMAEGRDPKFLDKEPVREWGRQVETPFGVTGIHKLDPANKKHVEFVHGLQVPDAVIAATTERYLMIFERLTGTSLSDYQQRFIALPN